MKGFSGQQHWLTQLDDKILPDSADCIMKTGKITAAYGIDVQMWAKTDM